MADSIREKILDELVATVKDIKKSAGFDVDIRAGLRFKLPLVNVRKFPTVLVIDESEDYDDPPPHPESEQLTLHVTLRCYVSDRNDLSQEVNLILANVVKGVMVDRTRGGNAEDSTLIGNQTFVVDEAKPRGGVDIFIDIRYRHATDDPFTAGC